MRRVLVVVVLLVAVVACSNVVLGGVGTTTTTSTIRTTTTSAIETTTSTTRPSPIGGYLVKYDLAILNPIPGLEPIPMGMNSWTIQSEDGEWMVILEYAGNTLSEISAVDVTTWEVTEFEGMRHSAQVVHDDAREDLRELLLPLEVVRPGVFGGIGFEPHEARQTLLLEEGRVEGVAGREAAHRLAGVRRPLPQVEQRALRLLRA